MGHKFSGLFLVLLIFSFSVFSQNSPPAPPTKKIATEEETVPPVLNNLPDAENIRNRAVYIRNADELKKALGTHNVLDLISFEGGTDAASAPYEAGKLLIVEFPTPQLSIDIDTKINARLAETPPSPPVYYRRVGNYAVFVFDATEASAANALIDQVKYEKTVRWLGDNPYLEEQYREANRKYATDTASLAINTVLFFATGVISTVLLGLVVGFIVFRIRRQQRATMTAFSDAGGMTRLNLDGLSEIPNNRLLKD